jgi:hypothetical protein
VGRYRWGASGHRTVVSGHLAIASGRRTVVPPPGSWPPSDLLLCLFFFMIKEWDCIAWLPIPRRLFVESLKDEVVVTLLFRQQ